MVKRRVFWLFVVTIWIAGASKSDSVITIFWIAWTCYWLTLAARRFKANREATPRQAYKNSALSPETRKILELNKSGIWKPSSQLQQVDAVAVSTDSVSNAEGPTMQQPAPAAMTEREEQPSITPSGTETAMECPVIVEGLERVPESPISPIIDISNRHLLIPKEDTVEVPSSDLSQPRIPTVEFTISVSSPQSPSVNIQDGVSSQWPRSSGSEKTTRPVLQVNDFVEEVRFADRQYYASYNNDYYGFGKECRESLSLSDGQVRWLNKVNYFPSDPILSIREFRESAAKLYLHLLKESDSNLRSHNSSLRDELMSLGVKCFRHRNELGYELGIQTTKEAQERLQSYFASYLFWRCCTGSIKHFIVGEPLVGWEKVFSPYYQFVSKTLIEFLDKALKAYYESTPEFSDRALRKFFEDHKFAWKKKLSSLDLNHPVKKDDFFRLCHLNERNPYLHNLYFEGAKSFGSDQMVDCLFAYSKHVILSKAATKNVKPLPTDIRRVLFPTKDSVAKWKAFIEPLPTPSARPAQRTYSALASPLRP